MYIIIYGDDTFRVKQRVKQMKDAFSKKFDPSGLNINIFPQAEKEKLDHGEVLQSVCSYPFLGEKRMVVIGGLIESTNKDASKVWIDGFKRVPESTIVIFYEMCGAKKLEKKSLFKSLTKLSDVHTYAYTKLQGSELSSWVVSHIRRKGGQIDAAALRNLVMSVGSDLWQMSNEIDKLIAYADGSIISVQMVSDMVRTSFEGQIFALMDAVSKKQTKTALRLLQEERLSGANDHYILTMLGRQVKILLAARSLLDENPRASKQDLANEMGVHPFVAQKAIQQAVGFEYDRLRKVHKLLYEFDFKIKTGQIKPDLAVDLVTDKLIA